MKKHKMKKFKEEQKFNQWWLKVLIVLNSLLVIYFLYKRMYTIEENMIAVIGAAVIPIIFLYFLKLKTEITEEGIKMSFSPFVKKNIAWKDIKKTEVLNYGFVGGWGIRFWTKYGTVYNVKGNKGLAIKLTNGKKFLIGTQKEKELKEFINKL